MSDLFDDFQPSMAAQSAADDTANYVLSTTNEPQQPDLNDYEGYILDDHNHAPSGSMADVSPGLAVSTIVPESGTGIDEQQWLNHKPLLILLYAEEGLTLTSVMNIMSTAGFLKGATEKMYKRRFEKWGIQKNEKTKTRRRALKGKDSQLLSDNDLRGMIEGVRSLCENHLKDSQGERWSVDDEFHIVEDEWDDAFGAAAWFINEVLKNPEKPSIESLHDDLKPMVETLGLFTLPTILTLVFRMCEKLKETDLVCKTVGDFLSKCRELAEKTRSARHAPLTKVLTHAYSVSQQDPDSLASLVDVTFSFYVGLVNTYAASESTTALSLVSFYLVYVNPESWRLDVTLQKLDRLLARSEKANGREDDTTLDILGLAIFILQKTDKKLKLLQYCSSMRLRIDKRRPTAETQLEGKLLERHLDATAVLAKLSREEGTDMADRDAMIYVEQYKDAQEKGKAEQDGYDKVLNEHLEEVKKRLEATSLS